MLFTVVHVINFNIVHGYIDHHMKIQVHKFYMHAFYVSCIAHETHAFTCKFTLNHMHGYTNLTQL